MLRSMYAGVSGLKAHMDKMDIVSNNIANVNTVGYKGSRATFKTMFSEMIQGASGPQGGRGGTNPQQIGLGATLGSIDKDMGTGSLQSTGRNQDLAINGNGFFVVDTGVNQRYTRAGSLSKDENGFLVNSATGYRVKGWQANANNEIDTNSELENLTLKQSMPAEATNEVSYAGNLRSEAYNPNRDYGDGSSGGTPPDPATHPEAHEYYQDNPPTWSTDFEAYDSQGTVHTVDVTFEKTDTNTWNYNVDSVSGGTINSGDTGELTFNADGTFQSDNNSGTPLDVTPDGGASDPLSIDLDFSDMTQFSGEMTADKDTSNGYKAGSLIDFNFDSAGVITGEYDNGQRQTIGQIALASFNNPGGLASEGETLFRTSNNSGDAKIGTPASGGLGAIKAGTLEMSNVDLSRQFTEMITTQRGFQANSKTISTSDQILQELVNLKR